ncbi:MAG: transcription antitermination factor NusB [Pseudomonadota bacterium]|nr:transcription antitermination factor NusB [Pseudomonadota bacterium]
MSGAKARLAAAELLMTVLEENRTLEEALATTESFDALSGADRGFARAMTSAAIRQLGRIDAGLAPFLNRPLETATPPSRALLRIGAAQAWLLETPDHAVVGETVAAAKLWPRAHRATGFLNAVLRKVVADRSAFDDAPVEANWPAWLRTIAIQGLGAKAANTLVAAQTETPDIYLTPKNGDPQALSTRVDGEVTAGYSVRVSGQAIDTIPGYETGDWWVQDVAATLPARLLNAVAEDKILDICAAPGGKTMQLAASGANVTAIDRSKPRLKRLKQNLWRTGFHGTVETVLADATQWRPDTPVDKILLDAPCSALGTLRRNPEGAWIKSPTDVARFSNIQERLLRASLEMLEPGGTLIYCVCSPLPHEGVEIVDRVLQDTAAARLPVKPHEIQGFEPSISALGDVLTLPNASFAHDAFYIARLKREI